MAGTVKLGLWVRLEAKPGKEAEVEKFLRGGLAIVEKEPGTVAWFAIRLSKSTFGIFDAFADESGRNAHLNGQVAAALKAKAFRATGNTALHRKGRCTRGKTL